MALRSICGAQIRGEEKTVSALEYVLAVRAETRWRLSRMPSSDRHRIILLRSSPLLIWLLVAQIKVEKQKQSNAGSDDMYRRDRLLWAPLYQSVPWHQPVSAELMASGIIIDCEGECGLSSTFCLSECRYEN